MNVAKVKKLAQNKSITKHRDQINAIKNRKSASILDINEFQKRHKKDVSKVDEDGNIVLSPQKHDDFVWMDD